MAAQTFRLIFADHALQDLEEIVTYWSDHDEPERGERYAHDLPAAAIAHLSVPANALGGRYLKHTKWPEIQEYRVFKGVYRILYWIDEREAEVIVLRFWHSHRDDPRL